MQERSKNRIENYPLHDSMRGQFGYELYKQMAKNEDVVVLSGDLGYGLFDPIRDDFPDRFFNCGASEQAMMGIAVGMTYEGKVPFVYSITNFALYRPYEWIRNYIDKERAPVKIIAAGRDKDYSHDGYSHWSEDAKDVLKNFPNIENIFPENKEDVLDLIDGVVNNGRPTFISLRR